MEIDCNNFSFFFYTLISYSIFKIKFFQFFLILCLSVIFNFFFIFNFFEWVTCNTIILSHWIVYEFGFFNYMNLESIILFLYLKSEFTFFFNFTNIFNFLNSYLNCDFIFYHFSFYFNLDNFSLQNFSLQNFWKNIVISNFSYFLNSNSLNNLFMINFVYNQIFIYIENLFLYFLFLKIYCMFAICVYVHIKKYKYFFY